MAFKAVIHGLASLERIEEIEKNITQFRAEKAAKYLGAMGITCDTIRRECLRQEKERNTTPYKAS